MVEKEELTEAQKKAQERAKVIASLPKDKQALFPERKKAKRSIPAGDRVALFKARVRGIKARILALHTTATNLPETSEEKNATRKEVNDACKNDLLEIKTGVDAVIKELQEKSDIFKNTTP